MELKYRGCYWWDWITQSPVLGDHVLRLDRKQSARLP